MPQVPQRLDTEPWRTAVLRIRDDKTLQLIRECKNEECLWNTNLPDYPNKETRLTAFEAIAKKLDIPNFKARHVSVKFKNLRNSYCQELKKMAADAEYKPKVFWFEVMDEFLKPHLQRGRSYMEKTKLLLAPKHNTNETNTDSGGQVTDGTDWAMGYSMQSDGSCSNSNCESSFQDQSNSTQESFTLVRMKRRKLSDLSENEEVEIKQSYSDIEIEEHPIPSPALTEVNTTLLREDRVSTERPKAVESSAVCPKDHYDAFGTYIATLLRTLPLKKALMLQPKIVDMIVSVGLEGLKDDDS